MANAPNGECIVGDLWHGNGRRLGRGDRPRMPDDAPNRWVDPTCRWCKPSEPCLTHDQRPKTLAQNRVIFGPSFGYEPTEADRKEAAFPWDT